MRPIIPQISLERAFDVARHVVVNPQQCAKELRQLSSAISYAAVVHKSNTTARAPIDLAVIDVHTLLNYLVRVHREQEGNLLAGLKTKFHSMGMGGGGGGGGGMAGFVDVEQFLALSEHLAPPDTAWQEEELRKLFATYAADAAANAGGTVVMSSMKTPLIDFVVFTKVRKRLSRARAP